MADHTELYESTVESALTAVGVDKKDTYVCEFHEGRQLYGFGLYENFESLDSQTSAQHVKTVEHILKHKKVIVPILHNNHFYLTLVDFAKKRLELFNSLKTTTSLTAQGVFNRWMDVLSFLCASSKSLKNVKKNQHTWTYDDIPTTQQKDGVSCGIFVFYFAEQLLNGKILFCNKLFRKEFHYLALMKKKVN